MVFTCQNNSFFYIVGGRFNCANQHNKMYPYVYKRKQSLKFQNFTLKNRKQLILYIYTITSRIIFKIGCLRWLCKSRDLTLTLMSCFWFDLGTIRLLTPCANYPRSPWYIFGNTTFRHFLMTLITFLHLYYTSL